jgi:hypothetical protein
VSARPKPRWLTLLAGLIAGLLATQATHAQGTSGASQDKAIPLPALEDQLKLQQTISAELSEQVRRLQAELAQALSARQEALAGTANLRQQLQALEQRSKDSAVYLELERARAQIAQEALAAQLLKVQQLEARLATEGRSGATHRTPAPLALIVTGGIGKPPRPAMSRHTQKTRSHPASVIETERCVRRLMGGELSYGTGRPWYKRNALALCRGSRSADRTLGCFRTRLADTHNWRDAIAGCRAR